MTDNSKNWTHDLAVQFCQALGKFLAPRGYGVALHGGCLHKEGWRKDCDVIVFPHNAPDLAAVRDPQRVSEVLYALREFGMEMLHDVETVHGRWRRLGSRDNKHVEIWEHEGRRVDVFFLC